MHPWNGMKSMLAIDTQGLIAVALLFRTDID